MITTYAIGDVHGMYDLLVKALAWIKEDLNGSTDARVILLGDYVDRGPQSREVLELLRQRVSETGGVQFICLRGNHDDMMLQALRGNKSWVGGWLVNGGDKTLDSYTLSSDAPDQQLDHDALDKHLDFIQSMPLYFEDEHRIFVHAGWPDPEIALDAEKADEYMLWYRADPKKDDYSTLGKMVVHGHTPVEKPTFVRGSLFLDTGACFGGGLTVAKFVDAADPTFIRIR